ncbi:uncharacterized protein F5147DRAFT_788388 [Suillus discolor]|uniref:Uncharacterized protein n=1 Tax=Suillus discolor TaxID=1912936 RepID=A0A9P7ET09_9AGAM|nr:uncharacterized protein F5147DRAFT_788388 [Suillus discolor]KAG2089342.1 hypothetical protein F5147DRAFT_788388 [Suillus discolor]
MSFFTPTPTPTPTDDNISCPTWTLVCGIGLIVIAGISFPCWGAILWFTLICVVSCVRGVLRAIRSALFGRALNVQLEPTEDDGVHGGGGMLIPLVFCGTWMRPRRNEEDGSVDQSEWSNIQPVSASLPVSSQVACKPAVGVGKPESAVSADTFTRPSPHDSKSSSPIKNPPKAAMVAVMIQMPSPVFRCRNDREGHTYNPARSDNPLSEYQIGVAQVQYVDARC